MIVLDLSILNQKGTPMFYSDLTANRPTAGIVGRIFIATDSPYGVFRDNGSSWDQIAGSGGGGGVTGSGTATRVAFWDSASSISSNANLYWDNTNSRLGIGNASPGAPLDVHGTGTNAQFNGTGTNNAFLVFQNAGVSKWQIGNVYSTGSNYFRIYDTVNSLERFKVENTGSITTGATITASGSSTGYQGIYNSNSVTIPASTTFASGGYTFVGYNQYYFQNFGGSATFQNNNIDTAIFGLNRIDFSAAGGTITMTQATGVRAMSAAAFQNQYNGTNSGTITHLAGLQILGLYRSAGSGTLSVTNAYGLIINNIDDYGPGFTYTNRWGIYQQGTSDVNYLAGSTGIGTNTISSNSIFEVASTTKAAISSPKMTTAQMFSIASPVEGQEIYKTDGYTGKFQFMGDEWLPIADGNEAFSYMGNQGVSGILQPFSVQTAGTGAGFSSQIWNSTPGNLSKTCPAGLTTGTTTTGYAGLYASIASGLNVSTSGAKFCFRWVVITPSVLSNATDNYTLHVSNGLINTSPSAGTFGMYYNHGTNSGAWTCFWGSLAGSSATSGVTLAINTKYTIEIEFIIGTSIKYWINGVLVLTQNTGLPTQLNPAYLSTCYIIKSAGTNNIQFTLSSALLRRLI